MFYSMAWDIHRSDQQSAYKTVVQALLTVGASLSPEGHYPGAIGVDLPFTFGPGRELRSPHASLRVYVPEQHAAGGDVRVELDCGIGVIWDPEQGSRNMAILIACADAIYAAAHPAFGWCHDHTYRHSELNDFLESRLPIGAQFVYVGSELVNSINWAAMKDRRYVVTPMIDGGVRIENPAPLTVPSLNL